MYANSIARDISTIRNKLIATMKIEFLLRAVITLFR